MLVIYICCIPRLHYCVSHGSFLSLVSKKNFLFCRKKLLVFSFTHVGRSAGFRGICQFQERMRYFSANGMEVELAGVQWGGKGERQAKKNKPLPFSLSRSLTLSMSGSSQLVQSGVDLTSSSELDKDLLQRKEYKTYIPCVHNLFLYSLLLKPCIPDTSMSVKSMFRL